MTPEEQVAKMLKDVSKMPIHHAPIEMTTNDLLLIKTALLFTIKNMNDVIKEADNMPSTEKLSIMRDLAKMTIIHDRIGRVMK